MLVALSVCNAGLPRCLRVKMDPVPAAQGSGSGDVDESLYSRQLYVMGHDAQVSW